jgi:cell division initiation protein
MTTAQDIREKTFEKSFNGYNMGQVDEFLDEMAADFSAMAKENAALKGKMRVLVEKVEEYRQTEDSMRLALLSAQKMSSQIESEAQAKADAILAEAKDAADRLTRRATDGIANEEAKLEEAKKATDKFFEHMRTVC